MGEVVVYTALIGEFKHRLRPPPDGPCKYVCFTDRPRYVAGWEYREPVAVLSGGRRTSRWHKCHSHRLFPEAEYAVWLDDVLQFRQDPATLVPGCLREAVLVTCKHSQRVCVYQEAQTCVELQKDSPRIIELQMQRYLAEKYPHFNGLVETGMLLRRNRSAAVRDFNEAWWREIATGSCRDQLSFNYTAWKQKLSYGVFPWPNTVYDNPWTEFRSHW